MKVCIRCLREIEAHEGEQVKRHLNYYDDENAMNENEQVLCEWCEDYYNIDLMYEI